ncbi:PucR family transcriptional regulator [Paraburkholderia sp. B3]|uniref:PucR family transcriptional regulator n=1 Tax=Paraburkholderia sp. B3 TaxID=3134791 RepID=UPI003982A661
MRPRALPDVLPPVPRISPRLRAKLQAALADNPSSAVERTFAALMELEGYSGLTSAIRKDIFASITLSANLWFSCLFSGETPSAEMMDRIEDYARRRVHQHVPLQSFMRAFQLGARELWRVCTDLARSDRMLVSELLFDISPYLLDYFDAMTQHIAAAYLAEQYQQARWRGSLLHQLYGLVFHTPDDTERFRETVEALGLDATLPRIALAIDLDLRDYPLSARDDALDRFTLAAARHLEVKLDALLRVWHRERLVLWVPCARGDSLTRNDQAVAARASALARAEPRVRSIGLGLMNEGARGWAASVDEAFRAVDFAPHEGDVHRYSSIAIEESVRSSGNVLRYLVSLAELLAGESDLLATLQMYFAHGQRRRQAAEALGVHPNTLDYRLERIETLLGAKLDDADWIARLDVALKLYGAAQTGHAAARAKKTAGAGKTRTPTRKAGKKAGAG